MTLDELRPFGDRLLVRPDPRPEMAGVIHIPQTVQADNPNFYSMTGTVLKLGDGVREDVYECCNRQCRYESRRTVGERCSLCGATQVLAYAGSGVHQFDLSVGDRIVFGRFAGKQIEIEDSAAPESQQQRVLIMREVEVIGVLDGDETVLPGYESARWNKPTKGITPVQDIS